MSFRRIWILPLGDEQDDVPTVGWEQCIREYSKQYQRAWNWLDDCLPLFGVFHWSFCLDPTSESKCLICCTEICDCLVFLLGPHLLANDIMTSNHVIFEFRVINRTYNWSPDLDNRLQVDLSKWDGYRSTYQWIPRQRGQDGQVSLFELMSNKIL